MIFLTDSKIEKLLNQYKSPKFLTNSGADYNSLKEEVFALTKGWTSSVIELKTKTFELIAKKAQIGIFNTDIFQTHVNADDIMRQQRDDFLVKKFYADRANLPDEILRKKASSLYLFDVFHDVSHLSSNTELLLNVGIGGIIDKIKNAKEKHSDLTSSQEVFYDCAERVFLAFSHLIGRIADEYSKTNLELSKSLKNIAFNKPNSLYEALQLLIVYFYTHENLMSSRIRTLGRLDKILYPFYKNDIEKGILTDNEVKEMLKYFLLNLSAMNVPFNLPFAIGGSDNNGEITNELSSLIVDAYGELDIYSPKIHVCVSDNTPKDFIFKVLRLIRAGKSSFVFANDKVIVDALKKVGISENDAKNYVLIGCYEPTVYVDEIGCTGNGGVNSLKMIEYVFTRGYDYLTSEFIGLDTGEINSYSDFICAVKKQLEYATQSSLRIISGIERDYETFYADPMLSAMIDGCLTNGADAYTGSAKYNNSSFYIRFFASFVDSISAVKKVVFDDKIMSFNEFFEVLKADWIGYEKLRNLVLNMPQKFGNNNEDADAIAVEFSKYFGNLVNGKPNGRGGFFKASNFTIDRYVVYGEHTMATPDGRKCGEPLSKNLCPVTGMDKNGITALINSVTKLDFTDYPNGAVLDIVLHPSAVSGEDGLMAMYALLKTYFIKGGMTMHGNVFDAEVLKKAQKDPKKYANLQVRVCGWNSFFVDLTPKEPEDMIIKSQNI